MLECVKAIREIDSTRWLYIGGNNYNSPDELKNLADIDDDYIVYISIFTILFSLRIRSPLVGKCHGVQQDCKISGTI